MITSQLTLTPEDRVKLLANQFKLTKAEVKALQYLVKKTIVPAVNSDGTKFYTHTGITKELYHELETYMNYKHSNTINNTLTRLKRKKALIKNKNKKLVVHPLLSVHTKIIIADGLFNQTNRETKVQ